MRLIVCLCLAYSSAVFAKTPSLEDIARSVHEAFAWPSGPYDIPFTMPKIKRVGPLKLQEVCLGACPLGVSAFYTEGTIFLAEGLDLEKSVRDRSILVHELVHYFQDMAGVLSPHFECINRVRMEAQAMAFQNLYLTANGEKPFDALGVNMRVRASTGGCEPVFDKTLLADAVASQGQIDDHQAKTAVESLLNAIDGSLVKDGKATYTRTFDNTVLAEKVAERSGLRKSQAKTAVESVLRTLEGSLVQDGQAVYLLRSP